MWYARLKAGSQVSDPVLVIVIGIIEAAPAVTVSAAGTSYVAPYGGTCTVTVIGASCMPAPENQGTPSRTMSKRSVDVPLAAGGCTLAAVPRTPLPPSP